MIAIATMESINPLVILAAMFWNALYLLGAFVLNLTTTTKIVMSVVAACWRPVGLFLLLVAGVGLAMAFWVVVVQLVGGMALIALVGMALKALWRI